MHVVAASGETVNVSPVSARSWPLAGTQMKFEQGQWASGLRMGNLPTGEARILTLRKIYKSNPWVWAAVNMKANGLASFPIRVTDWGENGQRVPVHGDHPKSTPGPASAAVQLDRRLNHPAPGLSRRRLVRRVMVDKLVYGNGIWVKDPDGMGGIAALYNAPWRQISVLAGDTRPINGYRIMGPAGSKVWDVGDVVQFGEGDSDALIAPSPLESLQYTIALMDALSRHLVSFFQNAARPSGVLQMETMPDDRELGLLREQIKELYSGPENAGRPLITSGSWSPMNGGTSYTDLVELAKLSRDEVSIAYNIPPPVLGIMDRAIKCLPADTLVSTETGPVAVEAVQPGQRVWSYVDGGLALRAVTHAVCSGFKATVTIRTGNRTLRASANHPVLVRRRHLLPRPAVSTGPGTTGNRYQVSHVWVHAGDIVAGDVLVAASGYPDTGGDLAPTRTVTEGFAEFCGLLLADGTVASHEVVISRAESAGHIDHYRQVMVDEFVCQPGRHCRPEKHAPVRLRELPDQTRFASRLAVSELRLLGLSGVALTKTVPAWVFGLNAKLRAAFVRGFADGDGSVNKKGKIIIGLANERMLRQLRELCIGLGVPVDNIYAGVDNGGGAFPNGIARKPGNRYWSFTMSGPVANYEVVGATDPADLARLEAGAAGRARRAPRDYLLRRTRRVCPPPDSCIHSRVLAVECHSIAEPVYDLTVEEGHSFIAEGVIVRNSNVGELREQFLRDVLASDGSEMTDEIVAQVMDPAPQWSGLGCGFDMSERLLPDIEALAQAFKELKRVYTLNELRRMSRLPDLPFEWANQPWMEPGSLPAGLAPKGATIAPDDMAEEDDEPVGAEEGDLEDEDDEDDED